MEKYSHGPFEVSGYKVTIQNPENEGEIIMASWKLWFNENISDRVIDREYPSLHAVYYNYHDALDISKRGYDMIIGYITKPGTVQSDPTISTIQVPTQDYRYMNTTDISPEGIFGAWNTINSTPQSELARSYGYDLDMYSEDQKSLTISVSVKE